MHCFIAFIRKHYIPEGVKITVLQNTKPFENNPFMLWSKFIGQKNRKLKMEEHTKFCPTT